MKTRMITARLDQNLSQEIEFLKISLKLGNTTSVLTQAIHFLYTTTKEKQSKKSSLELFKESSLLGCIEGPSDLSTTYKDKILDMVQEKHTQNKRRSNKSKARHEKSS